MTLLYKMKSTNHLWNKCWSLDHTRRSIDQRETLRRFSSSQMKISPIKIWRVYESTILHCDVFHSSSSQADLRLKALLNNSVQIGFGEQISDSYIGLIVKDLITFSNCHHAHRYGSFFLRYKFEGHLITVFQSLIKEWAFAQT